MKRGIIRKTGKHLKGAENGSECVVFFDRKPEALLLYEAGAEGGGEAGGFTHHVLISGAGEIDDELMGWVKEAAVFSAGKPGCERDGNRIIIIPLPEIKNGEERELVEKMIGNYLLDNDVPIIDKYSHMGFKR